MKKPLIVFCPWGDVNRTNTLSGMPYYLIGFLRIKYELVIIDYVNIDSFKLNTVTRLIAKILNHTSKLITRLSQKKYFQFGGVQVSYNYLLGKKLERISKKYPNTPILTFGTDATRFYKGTSPVFQFIDGIYTYKIDYYIIRNKLTRWEKYNIRRSDIDGINHSAVILCTSEIIKQNIAAFVRENNVHTETKIRNIGTGSNLPEVLAYNPPLNKDSIH